MTKRPSTSLHHRLAPPFWRHDWYALTRLRDALRVAIARDLRALPSGDVVDFGAGEAPYVPLFAPLRRSYLRADLENAPVVIVPGEPLPLPSGSAALVVSFQVLEHVWDLDWYLGECHRLLAPGGRLLLSTHGTWLYHPHPTDFRRWTRDGLERELRERGFETVRTTGQVGPLAWTTLFRAIGVHQLLSRVPLVGAFVAAPVAALFNARMVVEDALTPRPLIATNASTYVIVARRQGEP